ncbi:MAG: primosomal protein N' [Rhodospirillales bacterium]|nr:primosomal protein N' [Rhodospirillales bacterium]
MIDGGNSGPEAGGGTELERFCAGARVAVLLPLPLAGAYDYLVPEGLSVAAGTFVEVPLGGRRLAGVVWGGGAEAVDTAKLKPLARTLPAPKLPEVSRRFVEWVAAYTVQPPGAVLRMVMSVPEALAAETPGRGVRLVHPQPAVRPSAERARVLAAAGDGQARSIADLAQRAGCGEGVVRGLVTAGALEPVEVMASPPPRPDWQRPGRALSPAQAAAADTLRAHIDAGFAVDLLDGVPGAGKTEVYFEAVAAALARGRQVLVLLPEIALGTQWRARFADRFGAPPTEWHSDLSRGERRRTWRAVAEGRAQVIVGARSALFLPYPELGLIVVDEEHDGSFKQEDGVAYHARDMAVVRARLGEIACGLVSATPSLETLVNVRAGRYGEIALPERAGGAAPPHVEIIDLRRQAPAKGAFVAPPLRAALREALAAGRQALLFLNRRGYAPLTLCRVCGHRLHCPSCTAWLVEHRLIGRLQCHHCGYSRPLPPACPACGAKDALAPVGPGVERLAEEVASFLPEARTVLATSDSLAGPAAAAELVGRIERREVDLIIGTQIIAKGYHFPLLTLVGVVDADLGLAGGDLRAAERTFQLLYQVGGRAGREAAEGGQGWVLLQTAWPEHPVIAALAAGERARFMAAEEAERRVAGMPPFGRLAALIVSARDEAQADAAAQALARAAPLAAGGAGNAGAAAGVRILGPAPAPLALLRGRHRRRLLAIAPRAFPLSRFIHDWVAATPLPSTVRLQIDIDPQSFL